MRILLVNRFVHQVGGIEVYLRNLVPHLRRRDHELGFLCEELTDRGSTEVNPDGGPVWHSGMGFAAVEEIRGWRPDVIYVQQRVDVGLLRPLVAEYPAIWFAHDYGGLCISGSRCWSAPVARPCSRPFDWKCLLHYFPHRCGGLNPLTLGKLYREQQEALRLLRAVDLVVTHSEHMREVYLRQGFAGDRVRCLPFYVEGGVGSGRRAPFMAGARPLRLLFLGRLDPLKGVGLLLRALPAVAAALGGEVELTVAGEGPEGPAWRGLAAEITRSTPGLRVLFPGWLSGQPRHQAIQDADLMVIPSVWPEPFGMTGIEAASQGVPAVAFEVGGIRAWLQPGETGELAAGDPPTAEALSAAILRAVIDPAHYARLSSGAVLRAAFFGAEAHVDQIENCLRAAIERRGGRIGDAGRPVPPPLRAAGR